MPGSITLAVALVLWLRGDGALSAVSVVALGGLWAWASLRAERSRSCPPMGTPSVAGVSRSADELYEREAMPAWLSVDPARAYERRLMVEYGKRLDALIDDGERVASHFEALTKNLIAAQDMAWSTGLLARQAWVSSAQCGEAGHGFLSVSRDLADISLRAGDELTALHLDITGLISTMSQCRHAPHQLAMQLPPVLHRLDQRVSTLLAGYQGEPRSDVRWLQWAGGMRRLLTEVATTLLPLQERLIRLQSTADILALAARPACLQMLESEKKSASQDRKAEGLG